MTTTMEGEQGTVPQGLLELIGDVREHLAELVESNGGYGTSLTVDAVVQQCMRTFD